MAISGGTNKTSRAVSKPVKGKSAVVKDSSGLGQKILNAALAWEKIKPYCAYQERCHSEVKEKLYGFGLHRQDVEQSLARLIEENYLNEERFAIAYAGGHSRIKKWGKLKITHALKQKGVSSYCIKKALQQIDLDEYMAGLQKLANNKWDLLKKQPVMLRRFKCRQFLLQRGYESDLVSDVLHLLQD
jgi:regulatory protein